MKDAERLREQERDRMRFLYKRFESIGSETGEDLKTRLKGTPVAIRASGLAVVAAQLAASANAEDSIIRSLLAEWLLTRATIFAGDKQGEGIKDLLARCVQSSRLEYEAAQQEALRLMEQAKLLAAALWP